MKTSLEKEIITYFEIPRGRSTLTKIDVVLENRIRAFRRAKRIRRFSLVRQAP